MQDRDIWNVNTEVNMASHLSQYCVKLVFTECKERMFQFHVCEFHDHKYLACCQQYLVVCLLKEQSVYKLFLPVLGKQSYSQCK